MTILLAAVVGTLYAAGLYMMLRRSIMKLIVGLALLGHAANLLIFTAARPGALPAPLVPAGSAGPLGPVADPLPQALVLTAIVIGFGVIGFAVALIRRAHQAAGTDDIDQLRETEP